MSYERDFSINNKRGKEEIPLWTSEELGRVFQEVVTPDWNVYGISIDSRTLVKGDLFFALSGQKCHGNDYVQAAFDKGASGAVVNCRIENVKENRQIVVDDAMEALKILGEAGRRRVEAQIIAITGSAGKTGTKEALKAALSRHQKTHASVLSYNNHTGVPLSLARMPRDAKYGVFEIGMNHSGEIRKLVKVVKPDVVIITTVDCAHIGAFKNVEEIAEAKAEIFSCVNNSGTAILNCDNPHFSRLRRRAEEAGINRMISFGSSIDADVKMLNCDVNESGTRVIAEIMDKVIKYKLGLIGYHWAMNSLAVLAVLEAVGANIDMCVSGLEELQPLSGRGKTQRIYFCSKNGSFVVIDESYNANPPSMRAAIQTFRHHKTGENGRRIAVLGDMKELGDYADQYHCELAPELEKANVKELFVVGKHMTKLAYLMMAKFPAVNVKYFTDNTLLGNELIRIIGDGDLILVKGSNSSDLSTVVKRLEQICE